VDLEMQRVLALTLKLMFVNNVHETGQGAVISLQSGQRGTLLADGKNYRYYVTLAQEALADQHPVGVELRNDGTIERMGVADSDFITILADREGELSVYFQGHDGIFHLHRDHPEFQLLKDLLVHARDAKKRVWFASGPGNVLEDAMEFSSDDQTHH
jgi:hypothetical protein